MGKKRLVILQKISFDLNRFKERVVEHNSKNEMIVSCKGCDSGAIMRFSKLPILINLDLKRISEDS